MKNSQPTFFKGMFRTDRAAIWIEYNQSKDRWAVNVEVTETDGPKNALYTNLSFVQAKGLKADIISLWT